ncbi:hypothetical protein [Methylobacterium sp. B4]|uniref:hypothetical protein n=1 Tax=Methylobacterium sp. B4 TaxID=1938755 RepID=UPI0011B37018|nr:hypothetical protein [Methylobacterium sp. B4]
MPRLAQPRRDFRFDLAALGRMHSMLLVKLLLDFRLLASGRIPSIRLPSGDKEWDTADKQVGYGAPRPIVSSRTNCCNKKADNRSYDRRQ